MFKFLFVSSQFNVSIHVQNLHRENVMIMMMMMNDDDVDNVG